MKLSLDSSKAFAEAVAWTARAVAARPTVPVLAGVLLAAEGDRLTLSAFDYDVSARATAEATVSDPGTVLVPARLLAEITKSLPEAPVELALSGAEVVLTCGRAEFALLTMPAEDYPTLPEPPEAAGVVDGEVLRHVIGQVAPAASGDATLPMLTGLRIDIEGPEVSLGATDRYRIAARRFTWEPDGGGHPVHGVLAPAQTLREATKHLPPVPVEVGIGGGMLSLTYGGRSTTMRLLDGDFIDYRARLDDDLPTWATVEVAPLIDAAKRVALVADRGTPVRLAFTVDGLSVQAGGAEMGRGREHLPAALDGPPVEVAFNPAYLLDALHALAADAPAVRVGMTGPAKPTLFVPAVDEPKFRTLVMAIRLAG